MLKEEAKRKKLDLRISIIVCAPSLFLSNILTGDETGREGRLKSKRKREPQSSKDQLHFPASLVSRQGNSRRKN